METALRFLRHERIKPDPTISAGNRVEYWNHDKHEFTVYSSSCQSLLRLGSWKGSGEAKDRGLNHLAMGIKPGTDSRLRV